jgi:predicted amidophosphoribosyltransferase
MNELPIKICPKCGEEYDIDAQVCAECGGALVFPQDFVKRYEPPAHEEDVVLIREGSADYLKELMGHLAKQGIRAGVRLHGEAPSSCSTRKCAPQPIFGLYVAKTDEAAAKEVDRAHWLQGAPEEGASFTYTESELQGVCPACSTRLPEKAVECPECGLAVGVVEEGAVCPDCGAEVADDATRCPKCGAEFE